MKNPRHLFILVGFLAQSLTWETYGFPIIVTILWILALKLPLNRLRLSLTSEAIALVIGCVGSVALNKIFNGTAHFFIGDGLIALQLVRLMRTLTRREKLTSVVIACFHIGVLCTLAPNLRFIVLFLASLYLLPAALKDCFQEGQGTPHTSTLAPIGIQFVPTMRVCLWLLLGSVFVFLTFPRFTGSPLQLREGMGDQGSLLDTILDPRRGGRANSQQVLLQIEGANIGYLRCLALTDFDGLTWRADPKAKWAWVSWSNKVDVVQTKRFLSRKVFVKNSQYLGKVVPVDGFPVYMEQTFFSHPFRNVANDALECRAMWTTGDNSYEYYVEREALRPTPLSSELRQRLTSVPPQSSQLRKWAAQITAPGTNALQKARLLENHLRTNFRYELGTPELSRLTPIDDFIFNRKEGHCERFAASLALLLRMQGIPSRVAIGYVPTSKNLFSERMQVRFRDAHSWTEGYFDGVGWVTLDATPGPPPGSHSSNFLDMMEELEFAWYSHVINFNGFAQRDLAVSSVRFLEKVSPRTWSIVTSSLFTVLLGFIAARSFRKLKFSWRLPSRKRSSAPLIARHQYDEMLHALRKRGHQKKEGDTPIEFLESLRSQPTSGYDDASVVTDYFCRSFYGEEELTPEQRAQTKAALKRLQNTQSADHATDHSPQRS